MYAVTVNKQKYESDSIKSAPAEYVQSVTSLFIFFALIILNNLPSENKYFASS